MTEQEMNKRIKELGGLSRSVAIQVTCEKWQAMTINIDRDDPHFPLRCNCALCKMYYKQKYRAVIGDCSGCPLLPIGLTYGCGSDSVYIKAITAMDNRDLDEFVDAKKDIINMLIEKHMCSHCGAEFATREATMEHVANYAANPLVKEIKDLKDQVTCLETNDLAKSNQTQVSELKAKIRSQECDIAVRDTQIKNLKNRIIKNAATIEEQDKENRFLAENLDAQQAECCLQFGTTKWN